MTLFMNAGAWTADYPLMITKESAKTLVDTRLKAITDLTAYAGGPVEFFTQLDDIEGSFKYYDPVSEEWSVNASAAPKTAFPYCGIEKLPAMLAEEASLKFESDLQPLIDEIN